MREEQYVENTVVIARYRARIKVGAPEACWLWQGSVSGTGSVKHGQLAVYTPERIQHTLKAHRLAWVLAYGPIPARQVVCHHCDEPRCCNPAHLFVGTQAENLKDAARKGRFHAPRTRAGLTLEVRRHIHSLPARPGLVTDLARRYGVTKTCICLTRQGRFVDPQRGIKTPELVPVFEIVPSVQLPIRGEVR